MSRPMSKSQVKRFAVQKDRNKLAKKTKVHSVEKEYKRVSESELLRDALEYVTNAKS